MPVGRKAGFRWVVSPKVLQKGLDIYGAKLENVFVAVADRNGSDMQDYARKNAPWTDRTGNARTGLFYQVSHNPSKKRIIIYLSHSVTYGVFLELRYSGRYEIIWPTIEAALPRIQKDLQAAMGGKKIRKGKSYRKPRLGA